MSGDRGISEEESEEAPVVAGLVDPPDPLPTGQPPLAPPRLCKDCKQPGKMKARTAYCVKCHYKKYRRGAPKMSHLKRVSLALWTRERRLGVLNPVRLTEPQVDALFRAAAYRCCKTGNTHKPERLTISRLRADEPFNVKTNCAVVSLQNVAEPLPRTVVPPPPEPAEKPRKAPKRQRIFMPNGADPPEEKLVDRRPKGRKSYIKTNVFLPTAPELTWFGS